jgi:hypothetical protein
LDAVPGTDAVTVQLSAAAKKSGRVFDPQTMILTAASKKKRKKSQAAVVSKSPSAHLQSRDVSIPRGKAASKERSAPIPHTTITINPGEARVKMTEDNLDTPMTAGTTSAADSATEAPTKSSKAKPKPIVKPKPVSLPNGPVYLLLFANGKYKELRESELNSEAASVLKDPSMRLIKGQALIPQISFKAADE